MATQRWNQTLGKWESYESQYPGTLDKNLQMGDGKVIQFTTPVGDVDIWAPDAATYPGRGFLQLHAGASYVNIHAPEESVQSPSTAGTVAIRGDSGVITGSPVTLSKSTDATIGTVATPSAAPALRIGAVAGVHLRLDGDEIIAMTSDTAQGTLTLNEDLALFADGSARHNGGLQALGQLGANNSRAKAIAASGGVTSSTLATYVPVTGHTGGTFYAPPSGIVAVHQMFFLRSGTVGIYAQGSFEIKTGLVVGSGTATVAAAGQGIIVNATVSWIRAGGTQLVTGLVAGDPYNIRAVFASNTAGSSVDASASGFVILPQL